jgi:UPF0716 protein FxsA
MTTLVLVLVFLVVPFLELWTILAVADQIGIPETFVLLIAVAFAGGFLMKRAGLGVLQRIQTKTSQGQLPTDDLVDGAVILGAGALMLTPGFLTDIVALLLLLPPTRAVMRPSLKRWAGRKVRSKVAVFGATSTSAWGPADPRRPGGPDGSFIDAEAWEDGERGDDAPGPPSLNP